MNLYSANSPHSKQLVALTLIVSMAVLSGCSGGSGSVKRGTSGSSSSGGAGTTATGVQQTSATATQRTLLSPVSDLVDNVVDSDTGLLAPVTSQLDALTAEGAPLEPVGELSDALIGTDGALTDVLSEVNGALTSGKPGTGSVNDTQTVVSSIADEDSGLAPLAQTTRILLNPTFSSGMGATRPLDAMTGTGGALEPVGDVTAQLAAEVKNGALEPITDPLDMALTESPLAPVVEQLSDQIEETNLTLIQLQLASLDQSGVVSDVQGTSHRLLDNTALEPVADLSDSLIKPMGGVLGLATTPLEGATSKLGPLAPVGEAVDGLIGPGGAITPVVVQTNEVIRSISAESLANGGGLADVIPADGGADLEALLGLLSGAEGVDLAELQSILESGGDISGLLAGLDGGEGLTTLLNTLGADGLTSLLDGLASGGDLTALLGGLTEGGDLTGLLDGTDGLGGLLDGLSGTGDLGTAGSGSVTDVEGTVVGLLDDTALSPVADLTSGVVSPLSGALEPVTGPVDALTSPDGALAPVGDLTNALIGPQDGLLTPVVDSLNGVLSGSDLQAGSDGGLTGLPVLGGLLGQ